MFQSLQSHYHHKEMLNSLIFPILFPLRGGSQCCTTSSRCAAVVLRQRHVWCALYCPSSSRGSILRRSRRKLSRCPLGALARCKYVGNARPRFLFLLCSLFNSSLRIKDLVVHFSTGFEVDSSRRQPDGPTPLNLSRSGFSPPTPASNENE